jgi:serine phosphatase RsbU (regulator of sigma subunit)
VLAALVALGAADSRLSDFWFDLLQRLAPRVRDSGPVVIVAVDEPSLARHGQWPWPRAVLAELVERIAAAGPAAVGLDLLLPEADRFSGASLAARIPGLDAGMAAALATWPDGDRALARALAATPSVIGMAGIDGPTAGARPGRVAPVRVRGGDPRAWVPRHAAALRAIPVVDEAAAGHAILSAPVRGAIVRRIPLVATVGEALVPALALELLRVAVGAPAFAVEVGPTGIDRVGIGDLRIPTGADGAMWVYFTAHDPARFVSAAAVLAGQAEPALFERRLVLVGVTALGLVDQHVTPLDERASGVEIHAQALENILGGRLLTRPRRARWSEAALLLVLGAGLVWFVPAVRPAPGGLLALGLAGCVLGGSFALHRQGGVLLDGLTPTLGLALVYMVALAGTLAEADAQRRALRRRLETEREAAARLAGELEAARRIQLGLLPRADTAFPGESRFRIAAVMEPARVVGGDLFDFFLVDGEHLALLIGDVSGKGLPASLFMAATKAFYRSTAARHATRLVETIREVDAELGRDNPEAFFVTLVGAVLDVTTGRLAYVNAGHEAPWRLGGDGRVARLDGGGGPPLGVLPDFPYEAAEHVLEPDETLLLVTDGVTEMADPHGALFGTARVTELLAAAAGTAGGGEPARLVADLVEALRAFRRSVEPPDDVTILSLRWLGSRRAGGSAAGPPVSGP